MSRDGEQQGGTLVVLAIVEQNTDTVSSQTGEILYSDGYIQNEREREIRFLERFAEIS